MLFSLKKIAALAGARQGYLRGVALYNAGAVTALSTAADTDFAERITASVQDRAAGASYAVSVGLSAAGEAVMYTCECSRREGGACKHVVAALTHKYYRDMVAAMPAEGEPLPEQNGVAHRLVDGYFHEAQTAIRAASAERLTLLPSLHLGTPPTLTLSLGRADGRSYAVKDILQFRERFLSGEVAEYGGGALLCHHPEAFEPQSRPLLSLVRAAPPTVGRTRRELSLSPLLLDRVAALYAGGELSVGEQTLPLQECDPPLSVEVLSEEEGVTLLGPVPQFAMGEERMLLLLGGVLYCTTPAFAAATRGLLAALREAAGRVTLTERQAAEFAGSALPQLSPYITFFGNTDALERHRPEPLSAAIWLDMPTPMTLSARVEFRYGERVYTPAVDTDGDRRDRLGEWRVQTAVRREFPVFNQEGGIFLRECTEELLYDFLADGLPDLSRVAEIYTSDVFREVRVAPPPAASVGVRLKSGLLELEPQLGDMDPAELSALLDSYRRRKRYHRLKNGAFLSLESPALRGLSQLFEGLGLPDRRLPRGRVTVPLWRTLFVDRVLSENRALGYTRDAGVRALLKSVKAVEESEFTPPATLCGELRRYQRVGFSWLRTMETYGFGGILADDMGLGKTVQIIALLLDARERGITLPSLVVCPASLVLNWESELKRFAPSLQVRAVIGDGAAREESIRAVREGEVVVTSYDLLKRDIAFYEGFQFHYQVLDEAQYIKNHATQNARAVKAIQSVQRFALTGTPVENRLGELWSIFDFLMPGFLFSYHRFSERFEKPAVRDGDREALSALSRLCSPFILRRLKKDVLQELPPKTETVYCVPMEDIQRRTYLAAAKRMSEELRDRGQDRPRLQVLAMLMRLRQICCDPALCFENYRGGSAKLEACAALTAEAVGQGHRVLIFSQFTSMLAILQKRLQNEGVAYYLLEGATPKEKRAAMVEAFNSGDGAPVFLISLKAGGTGLNLTAADVVIHYDPWWNSSVQNQATDRAHRIGQHRPVQVYKLIAKSTVEEKILRLQEQKQSLADAVVRADGLSLSALSDGELIDLICSNDTM